MKQADFAERLTRALDLRALSAADLSRATGVSEGTISCYKNGKYQEKQNARLTMWTGVAGEI